ncbi:MAG: glycine-rich domain-containing protein [Candidatus Paceibacterota bacterium]
MINIIRKFNILKREFIQCLKRKSSSSGFVLLFAVTISAIILSITLGLTNIAFNEIKFSTSVKDSNNAFYAADTGYECALFNDKSATSAFDPTNPTSPLSITCNKSSSITVNKDIMSPIWNFNMNGLGIGGQSCAQVTVDKHTSLFSITSKGYNISDCSLISAGRVERELKINYSGSSSFTCSNLPAHATFCEYDLDNDILTPPSLVPSCTLPTLPNVCEAMCDSGYTISGSGEDCVETAPPIPLITASGGTITYADSSGATSPVQVSGGYKIHTFTSATPVKKFIVNSGSGTVDVLVVGGGGGGAGDGASWEHCMGSGGAGGYRYQTNFPIDPQEYQVKVGTGGSAGPAGNPAGNTVGNGGDSAFSTITSTGGGAGKQTEAGKSGGSGGGAGAWGGSRTGGAASAGQGNAGGSSKQCASSGCGSHSGGGGGSASVGGSENGIGGNGTVNSISGSSITYAAGGSHGGGNAVANTGNGGGGGLQSSAGGSGGSGIVIIRYLTP